MPNLEQGGDRLFFMSFLTNSKSTIKVFACILLVAPIACNFIIGTQRFSNLPVIGDEKLWLQFYGSYIGSALAVIGALYVCYFTIEENRKMQEKTIKETYKIQKIELWHKEILTDIDRVSTLFESFVPSDIINFLHISQCPSPNDREKEMRRLQQLYAQYCRLLYMSEFHYNQEGLPESCNVFFKAYQKMLGKTIDMVGELINFYKKQEAETWQEGLEKFKEKVMELESETKPEVVALAKKYITYLLSEFEKIRQE